MEIIVVDNASTDETPSFLEDWAAKGKGRELILNDQNLGFAAANNQGLNIATGDYLVMLNNDTYVTPGWIRTLIGHLNRDNSIGLIGPVTNNIGNEAKIDIQYADMNEMLVESAAYTRRHIGQVYPLRTAAFFCVMLRRDVYQKVGPLDEAFGIGFFEDDDYCRRLESVGLRVVCAEDVFVHHHLSASFSKLKQKERQRLFQENKILYEKKWGEWVPHGYRKSKQPAFNECSPPHVFEGQEFVFGQCNVCGQPARFYYNDEELWRESLNCEHCRTTSRYRSIARGILRAIEELTGKAFTSLAGLPGNGEKTLRIYDTQPPFYYEQCSYPIPDLLKAANWIDVELSQFRPDKKLGVKLAEGVTNQNLERLTFSDSSLDVIITSDVMEHVRLDGRAHKEIYRVLKPGGVYIFTVPHNREWDETLVRVQICDPDDPSKDVHLLEPEYHGDTNNEDDAGVLAYRTYGKDLEKFLQELGFTVEYSRYDIENSGIMNTELYYCRKLN
jgi:GT2 family glycosyltransferase/SAM-dependent methyltransferase